MDCSKLCIGSVRFARPETLPSQEGTIFQWHDLRGMRVEQWSFHPIHLVGCVLDSPDLLQMDGVSHTDCWLVRKGEEGKASFTQLHNSGGPSSGNSNRKTALEQLLAADYQAILEADDFGLNPSVKAYVYHASDLSWMQRIALALPLLYSQNDIIARNGLYWLSKDESFDPFCLQHREMAAPFLWSLILNQCIRKDALEALTRLNSSDSAFVETGFQYHLDRIQSDALGDLETGLLVASEFDEFELDIDWEGVTPRLGQLVLHGNPFISEVSLKLLRSILRTLIFNRERHHAVSNTLDQLPDHLK